MAISPRTMTENGFHNDAAHDESLAGQRLRLASLESCEERIRMLRDQECDLEVEAIAAEAALHSATARLEPGIDPALALRIGRELDRRHAEQQLEGDSERRAQPTASARQLDRLHSGRAALQAWLDASQPREPGRVVSVAKITLLIATIATVWAAFAIHLAFLLLLVAVVGPVSFALERGGDREWHRVGARRRYEASGLADLPVWNEESVTERIAELDVLMTKSGRSGGGAENGASRASAPDTAQALAEDDGQLAADLAAAHLSVEDTRGDMGEWLRLVARAGRSRESLERVKAERAQLRAEAAEYRDQLVRYLQRQGVRPTQVPDSVAAIAEGLERLTDG